MIDGEEDSAGTAEGSTCGDRSASKQREESPKAMPDLEYESSSSDETAAIRDMLECVRHAKFIFWEGEDPAEARESESGVPCGTELRRGVYPRLGGLRTMRQGP